MQQHHSSATAAAAATSSCTSSRQQLRFGHKIRLCFAVSDVFRKGCLAVCFLLWRLFDCSSNIAAPQQQQQPPAAAPAAGSSREQQAGSRRQPQAAAGSSRQQQTPAAGSSRQRQAAAKFQFYSMVSEVTLGPFLGFLCYVLDTKLGGGLLFRMCFEKGVWLFVSCFGGCLIAAAPQQHHSSHQQLHQQQYGFRSDVRPFFGVPLLRFGHEIRWWFAVSDVFRKGCLAVCFLLWRLFDCSSTTAAPQQQQQPPAAAPAAGSSREQQAAAGSCRQQAAAGSSMQQQTPAEAFRARN